MPSMHVRVHALLVCDVSYTVAIGFPLLPLPLYSDFLILLHLSFLAELGV